MGRARKPGHPAETEAQFQVAVTQLADAMGWGWMHVRPARAWEDPDERVTTTTVKGWPDLTLWHERWGVHLLAELKGRRGQLSAAQRTLLPRLRAGGFVVVVWRPQHWRRDVEPTLRGGPIAGQET